MGFRKSWDTVQIMSQLRTMAMECASPFNDGFTAHDIKRDLVEIKFFLEDALERCPQFAGEEEWYHKRLIEKIKE
jgi:hypothetical protein